MIGKNDRFWSSSEKQWALELMWRQIADCSKGGIWPPETHDHRQWTAEYVGSLAAWMTTTEDGGGWNQGQAGCCRKDTVVPDRTCFGRRAQPAWSRCVPETTASEGLAASVWRARTINLPLHRKVQKFSSGTGSTGWSRKKGRKTVVWCVVWCFNTATF